MRCARKLIVEHTLIRKLLVVLKFTSCTVASLSILYVVVRLGLNYSGYCYEQGRYISNQEKIEIVAKHIIRPHQIPKHMPIEEWLALPISIRTVVNYRSTDEFFETNKDCCEVTDFGKGDFGAKGEKLSVFDKLFGITSSYVRVHYQVRHLDEKGQLITAYAEPYFAISNCGHLH
jgi:hypothetical protein